MGEPARLLIINATLARPITIGVHPNDWSTLQGPYITFTKRYMSSGGWDSHIYDADHIYRLTQSKRNVGLPTHDWGPF